jgi:hypothetical protein
MRTDSADFRMELIPKSVCPSEFDVSRESVPSDVDFSAILKSLKIFLFHVSVDVS